MKSGIIVEMKVTLRRRDPRHQDNVTTYYQNKPGIGEVGRRNFRVVRFARRQMPEDGEVNMSTHENNVVEQRGLWLEEFEVGMLYRHRPGRTVTEADNVIFSTLTMNPQPLHLDAAWSATQAFGQRLVNSLFTLSTLVGLSISQLTLGTLVANLGFREVTFPAPVFIGDTLYAESLIVSARPSESRPGEGVVELKHTARNQDGVIVAQCQRAMLVRNRPIGQS